MLRCGTVATAWIVFAWASHAWGADPDAVGTKPAQQAEELVQAALQEETLGGTSNREESLRRALELAPNSAPARWVSGQVKVGPKWFDFESLAADAKRQELIEDYRRQRRQAVATAAGQLELADWCRLHKLPDQERVHLIAALEYEPDHAVARQRLGFIRAGNQWFDKAEIAEAEKRQQAIDAAEAAHRGKLSALGERLEKGGVDHNAAIQQLAAIDDPQAVYAMERFVSSRSAAGAACVIDALATRDSVESTQSLARHALHCPWPAARQAAAAALRGRDEHAYVPLLLSALQTPWLARVELLTGPRGKLLYRHTWSSETENNRKVAVADHVFDLRGELNGAGILAAGQAGQASLARTAATATENARIEELNARVARILSEATGTKVGGAAEDCWRWWNNRNEVYLDGDKSLEQNYALSGSRVEYAPPPPPTVLSTGMTHECLAAGTPIWTNAGPVAVDRLHPGDLVLAQHPVTGEIAYKPVLKTTVRNPTALFAIQLEGRESIRASGGHPFWVAGVGWVLARDLKGGQVLHGIRGAVAIESNRQEEKESRSFNLVVADFHSYCVGEQFVLSHDNSLRKPVEAPLPGWK